MERIINSHEKCVQASITSQERYINIWKLVIQPGKKGDETTATERWVDQLGKKYKMVSPFPILSRDSLTSLSAR